MCKWFIIRQGKEICQYSYFHGKLATATKCHGEKDKCMKGKYEENN